MSLNKLFNAASFVPDLLQSPSAWFGHLPFAYWVIQEVKPKIFVELGTHYGHSYFSFCQSVVDGGLTTECFAIDTWQGDEHAGQYSDEIYNFVQKINEEKYPNFSNLLRMTFDVAADKFSDESVDLLHIDGLHTYEAVSHDFETWLPKLAPGAVVLFHDITVRDRNFGVWKFWEELQAIYPNSLEFFHSHGLGVLQLNNAPDEKKLSWLQQNSPEKQILIDYFTSLGKRQQERFELSEKIQHINNIEQILSVRDEQFATLNLQIATLNLQIASLNQGVAEQTDHINNLYQVITDRDAKIGDLRQKIKSRNKQINDIYGSTSWWLTKPVRFSGRQLLRAKKLLKLIAPAIKLGGGVMKTTIKALNLFRKEGVNGIKRGLSLVITSGKPAPKIANNEFDRNNYDEWIRRYDTINDEMRSVLQARVENLPQKPLISVVMPVFNPKPEWLIEAVESVRNQIYPHWELCIADDASTDTAIRPILERYGNEDNRIKVTFRENNGHISAASNSALELVAGDWVALLDHDDLMREHALFWVADAICKNPTVSMIYSDEDKIDETGKRFNPYFKADWNIDLFYSHNMFSHLGVYSLGLLKEIGGFRVGYEGAQDYDLVLRCIEKIKTEQIHHIPRVLYHWRAHDESTSKALQSKPYAMLAAEMALNEHFQRKNTKAKVELRDYAFKVCYDLPDDMPLVSLIIPTRNGYELIRQCIDSILEKTTYPNYEIIIVDNGSDDSATIQYFDDLKGHARVRVILDDGPFNYSALNNGAVKLARGEVVGLLNNDLEVISPEWLTEMVSLALQPDVGAVGARLWYPNNTLQHGGVILGLGGVAGHSHKHLPKGLPGYAGRANLIQSYSAVTGACLLIRREVFEEVNGLNETDLPVAFNDVDFCLRVKEAGYRNIWTPYAELYHHESATRGSENTPEKKARFNSEVEYMFKSWGNKFFNDPAYNPNLSLEYDDFSFAWPPRIELFESKPQEPIRILNRIEKALFMINKEGLGLEIGPSHNPVAPKKEGFNVHILDHATADQLREKYKGHENYGVKIENIEEVDFVWHGETFQELIGNTYCYDWIIASHVIEHVPDFISFLQQCHALLKPEGILSLVIPDKRYCFDYFSSISSTGNVLDAFSEKRVKPSQGQIFDHFANASKLNGNIAWSPEIQGIPNELIHDFAQAKEIWFQSLSSQDYIDAHCWRFSPASFRLMMSDLQRLGLISFEIKAEFNTVGCEFYMSLGKADDTTKESDRVASLNEIKLENG